MGAADTRRTGFEIIGIDKASLTDYWGDRMRTLHGFSSRGFPNCFIMNWIYSTLGSVYYLRGEYDKEDPLRELRRLIVAEETINAATEGLVKAGLDVTLPPFPERVVSSESR